MDIPCVMCQTVFPAKRASARYCSERCKKRAQRDPGRPASGTRGTLAAVAPIGSARSADALEPDAAAGAIAQAVARELQEAQRTDSVMGAVALSLAAKLDAPGLDTGSSIAALARQLQASMEKALDGVQPAESPLARRQRERQLKSG